MTVHEMAEALSCRVLSEPEPAREINDVYIGDLLSWVMGRAESDNAWITIMSNINIVAVASLSDVSCILLSEGVVPEKEVQALAESKGINLYSSELTSYALAVKLSELLR